MSRLSIFAFFIHVGPLMSFDPASAGSEPLPDGTVYEDPPQHADGSQADGSQAASPVDPADPVGLHRSDSNRAEPLSLLDHVLSQEAGASSSTDDWLDRFLQSDDLVEQIRLLFGADCQLDRREISRQLNHQVAEIDEILNEQVNAILHHKAFQKLEASWRGLRYLVDQAARYGADGVRIRVLHLSWRELTRDLERAPEFDQSQLFRKVYEDEFGTPGGQPYGMLIGDYEIHPRPTEDHPFDDIKTLKEISSVAAAAFCPFITSVSPAMFGLNDFSGLQHVENLSRGFEGAEFIKWRAFRELDDARFVGLTLPRVLMRRPWAHDPHRSDHFCFEEDTAARDRNKYLWGNAAYAYGEVAIRAFAQSGWLAEIRGVQRDLEWGGLVTGLAVDSFGTDREGVAPKSSTEVTISDLQESSLSNLGFLPLSHCWDTEYAAFYSSQSTQKPRKYDRVLATQNAKISAMLHYVLCVSRFAHYLKVIARDKIGSNLTPEDCQKYLDRWIKNYVTPDDQAAQETKARRPLRGADIRIITDPSKPGNFLCTMNLWPHYQLDDLTASVRLNTSLKPMGGVERS